MEKLHESIIVLITTFIAITAVASVLIRQEENNGV